MNKSIYLLTLALGIFSSGCGTLVPDGKGDVLHSRAAPLKPTQTYTDLSTLPSPRGQITAAIYDFKDKTGQYRPSPSNALSTSVTQGADAILIKALLDSRWFIPVERAGLQNLLTERKITQSAETNTNNPQELTPVSAAQIIIQGTIVSYDSNTHTGGTGARLLGLGSSQSFREDKVTVNLRLIDIDDGRVLHSVSASKKIFSRQLNTGLFSYIDVDQILELEAGNSYNEPSHIAITEAIESALINLIGEGVLRNTWQLADETDIDSPAFERFITEKQREEYTENALASAAAAQDRKAFIDKVRLRINRGKSGIKYHLAEQEKASERKKVAYAKAQRKLRKENQEAIASLNKSQADQRQDNSDGPRQQLAQASTAATNDSVKNNVELVNTVATEKLIADQAQAILNTQANIQIQATKQAHQAALYAQKLILQKQSQQKQLQQRSSQQNTPARNKKLEALENQQGNATQANPLREAAATKLAQNTSTDSPTNNAGPIGESAQTTADNVSQAKQETKDETTN